MYSINWGDLTPEQFLNEYWQKKPLLIRQAVPDFEPLLEPDELAGLALEEEVESRLIQVNPDQGDWSLKKGPLDEALFANLPESRWTLLVQAVDHYIEDAADLMDAFSFIPRWRIDDLMISFATPGGGVGPHYDNYDVFLLQASGTRRWELGKLENSESPRVDQVPVMLLSEFEALESYELEPGDMLYLPPQLAHNGVSTSDDCMTYSIGFRAPSRAELLNGLTDFWGERLSSEDRFADPDLRLCETPGEIDQTALTRVESMLTELLSDKQALQQWFGSYITEPKYADSHYRPESDEFDEWLAEQDLSDGISATPDSRLAFIDSEKGVALFANGELIDTQGSDEGWIRSLCNERHSGAISPTDANLAVVRHLFIKGALLG